MSGLWTHVNREKPKASVRPPLAPWRSASQVLRAGALVWGLVAVLGLSGCGRPEPRGPATVVVVLVDAKGKRLPFDPEALRARRAREAVDAVAKKSVALSIEMALLPEETEAREAYVADALEALARGLDAEKRRDPEAFELGSGNLAEVAFRFDPVARNVSAKLSDDGTKLVVGTSRQGTPPVTSEDYAYLFRKRADERRRARYASKRADEVPPNEREAYFLSLGDSSDAPREERARLAFFADRTLSMLDLYTLTERDRSPLSAKVRHALVSSGGDVLRDAAFHHAEIFASAPADSSLRRAEAAYSAFLRREEPKMTEEDALGTARMAFLRASRGDEPTRYALPSFDRLGYAVDVLSAYRKAGQTRDAASPKVHAVVCPEERVRQGNRVATSRSGHCGEELYAMAREDEAARRALVAYAKREDDVTFAKLLFGRLSRGPRREGRVFAALGDVVDARMFPVALTAVAEALEGSGDAAFVSEARAFVRAHPERRGDVAYLVARALTHREAEDVFTRFDELFGEKLTLQEYERFLSYGDEAVASTPEIFPALAESTRGLPRMRAFTGKLGGYLDRAGERNIVGPDATYADLKTRLCDDDDAAGIAEVSRALTERRRSHPGEPLTDIFSDPCPKRAPSDPIKPRKPKPATSPPTPTGKATPTKPRAPRQHDLKDPFHL